LSGYFVALLLRYQDQSFRVPKVMAEATRLTARSAASSVGDKISLLEN
jgi:hypothetical protein